MSDPSDPAIFLVYARATNGVIGNDGALPWHLPADLKRFKALTLGDGGGKPMIMGRKTFESLPGLLPGRRHIVLTRNDQWDTTGAEVVGSVKEALAAAKRDNENGEIAIVGGAAIYDVFMRHAGRIELTEVHADYDGDTFMKPLGPDWQITSRDDHTAEGECPAYSFVTLTRDEQGDDR